MMYIFRVILSVVFYIIGNTAFAQTSKQIIGKVNDINGTPLQSVSVQLFQSSDSLLLKLAVSDINGRYEFFGIKPGNYLIGFSAVGYETRYTSQIQINTSDGYEIPPFFLTQQSAKLNDVVIVSKKPVIEVKVDKTVFNVESSINATGSDAFEMLRKSPGVQIDNNDNINLKGKTGVRIYVDGKMLQLDGKDLTAYLKSINSNDMEAIEMIGNPSAKYDASGNAGIINIRLKKNKKFGTNGSITSGFTQGVTPKGNGGINLNYRDKKINIFGNLGGSMGWFHSNMNLYRLQNDTIYDQLSKNLNNNNAINTKMGVDYFIDSRNTIGIMATYNYSEEDWKSTSNSSIYYRTTGAYIKTLQALNDVPSTRRNANINLNYRYTDTSGNEINFDADHGLFRGTGASYQPNNYLDQNSQLLYNITNRNNTPTNIDINTAKVDIEQRLAKGKIGYGAKFSLVKTDNTFDFFTDDPGGNPIKQLDRSNQFTYNENVNAAYVNYQASVNEKFSYQAGLRTEQTNSEGVLTRADGTSGEDDKVKRSYIDCFPSAALTYNVNDKHSLN
ncbi:MAG: TonB-dependent receptor, partial [Ferruginibacter sp.]|nr:TonB-dependent receptor [Ferruginibacter sp.]